MTHTPGPWKAIPETLIPHEGKLYHAAGEGPRVAAKDRRIAFVSRGSGDGLDDEAEANARLIAAAPALLEALKALVWAADAVGDAETGAIKRAKAAIAQATGDKS